MSLISVEFLLFVLCTFFAYYICPQKYRWIVLLVFSVIFYAINSGFLILCIATTTVTVFLAGKTIDKYNIYFNEKKKTLDKNERKVLKEETKKRKKLILIMTIIINIGLLVFFKYFNFLGGIIDGIFSVFGIHDVIPVFRFILPLGISYYTLMAVSYIVDVYRGINSAENNFFKLFLFLIYFPHIVEGPFGRYHLLSKQLFEGNRFNYEKVRQSCLILLWGLIKKLIIADRCSIYVNEVFGHYENYGGITVLIAILFYTFQIYMDFSGCIDIVTGVSGLFGVELSENFRRPFFSKTINEFWRRWHITLGVWLKDYVYYPVLLSSHFKKVNAFAKKHIKSTNILEVVPVAYALFFVWFSNGLWHGASFKYVLYGLYYYFIMIVAQMFKPLTDRVIKKLRINTTSKVYIFFQILRTGVFVCLGMLIFRADSFYSAVSMLKSVVSGFAVSVSAVTAPMVAIDMRVPSFLLIIISMVFVLIVGLIQERGVIISRTIACSNCLIRWTVYILAALSVIVLGIYGAGYDASSFIYGQF